MARDLPSERPVFERTRDTPGRDAFAMRQAARARTKKGNGMREDTTDLKAATMHRPPTPGDRRVAKPSKLSFRAGVTKAAVATGIPKLIDDAYWSFTHPRDRVLGRGRAKDQRMEWVGPNKLFPAARIPTRDPDWEIIRNKARDVVVGLSGRYPYTKIPRGHIAQREQANLSRAERTMQQVGNYDDAIAQAILNQARRDRDIAFADRKQRPAEFTFSAVPSGTREAHASLQMNVFPHENYVDYVSKLTDPFTRRGEDNLIQGMIDQYGQAMPHMLYEPREVPIPVMLQLLGNALGPQKPIRSWIVNEQLERAMRKYAARHGIPFTFDNGWGGGR